AVKFIQKYKRVDLAIDAFYSNSNTQQITNNLNAVFDRYKEKGGDSIGIDGTVALCNDLGVNPEDVVLLAIAYELKSPGVGEWPRKGWQEGWKNLGCDGTIEGMKTILPKQRQKLGKDSAYFNKVYSYTFDFAKSEGQRSLGIETACAFWALLLPHGLEGGALGHVTPANDDSEDDDDQDMENPDGSDSGWSPAYVDWWFEFLNEKGGKGISKDTWAMLPEFIRSIDSKFETHDLEAAWPSTIDDFVEWAKARLASGTAP
ncbi:defective in Cullin neddylation protein 1, partial [Sistotremastrum niveocremeum HHB9708]